LKRQKLTRSLGAAAAAPTFAMSAQSFRRVVLKEPLTMTEVKIRRSHRSLRERLLLWQRAYVAKAVDGHNQFLGRGPTPEAAKEAVLNKVTAADRSDLGPSRITL
jgi:hypothetical protein